MVSQRNHNQAEEDFSDVIAYFRSIDITDWLGGDRKADPKMQG